MDACLADVERGASANVVEGEPVVAGIVVFVLLAVAMIAIMLYGIFTEGRRR
jgi:hypothetical protein